METPIKNVSERSLYTLVRVIRPVGVGVEKVQDRMVAGMFALFRFEARSLLGDHGDLCHFIRG